MLSVTEAGQSDYIYYPAGYGQHFEQPGEYRHPVVDGREFGKSFGVRADTERRGRVEYTA